MKLGMLHPGLLFTRGPAKLTGGEESLYSIYYVCIYYAYSFMEMVSFNEIVVCLRNPMTRVMNPQSQGDRQLD